MAAHQPTEAQRDKALASIAVTTDPGRLRRLRENALRLEVHDVADAALRRPVAILPAEAPGSVEHDFWQTVHAFEELLTEGRGKTTRLNRTRQKVQRVGVMKVLEDWARHATSIEGFDGLIARRLPELTGEAIVLRHADSFGPDVRAAAAARLGKAGEDPTRFQQPKDR